MHHRISADRYRRSLRRLRRDRGYFLTAAAWIESSFPGYIDALEFPVREEIVSLTELYRPAEFAAQCAFACLLTLPPEERERFFPTPADDDVLTLYHEWERERESRYGESRTSGYLLMWRGAQIAFADSQPQLMHTIEQIVLHESPLTAHDRQYVLFLLGLFLLVAHRAQETLRRTILEHAPPPGGSRLPTNG